MGQYDATTIFKETFGNFRLEMAQRSLVSALVGQCTSKEAAQEYLLIDLGSMALASLHCFLIIISYQLQDMKNPVRNYLQSHLKGRSTHGR